ncbi:MAG: hypothetical protein K9N06_04875 [Candidatus Cloacimonetes bacterium]|nr:hypothetical protein [Candidatus Cloacimonadota bacterium]
MRVFSENLQQRRKERRQKRTGTWSGLLIKVAAFILLIILIRFIMGTSGKRFGDYWKEVAGHSTAEVVNE